MRRLSLLDVFLLLGLAGVSGCGPVGLRTDFRGQPWPWLDRNSPTAERSSSPRRERSSEKSLAKLETLMVAEEGKPAKKTEERTLKTETKALAKFDPETLKMIEEELTKTPLEEREQFYSDVVSLPPAMVRQIIQTRRIVRQVGQDAPTKLATPDHFAQGESNPIQQTSGEGPANGGIRVQNSEYGESRDPVIGLDPSRDPGLGAADPWNRETQPQGTGGNGRWINDNSPPPAPLPFNRIPSSHGAGHSAGYGPNSYNSAAGNPVQIDAANFANRKSSAVPEIQPPPGGAMSPINRSRQTPSNSPNTPLVYQDARIPNDYNPQAPPVPNYGQAGGDPFAGGNAEPVRTASQNPDQKLPGLANSLSLGESFGPPADANNPANINPNTPQPPASWKSDLGRVIATLEAEVANLRYADQTQPAQKQAYIQKHVYLRMLYLMAGQEARAVAAIPQIPEADQEFWQQTFWAMSNYFDSESMPENDYRATQTIAQLRTAIYKLQENARLELHNVAFCHKISSFGNFDRFPRDEFGPGQPVLVYAEVTNFKSNPTTLPQKPNETAYLTKLKSSIEIHKLSPSGELVDAFQFDPTEDLCHNHRRDYFHSYEFTIPQQISLGPHVMTLTVEDQLSRKVATYRLNFMVK